MATIKAIESRSIHQIQSGQVIVDLTSVVKELVENSLDAGATSIEVRFKNHGLDSIEVQDNGKGIAPEDFETIALKHYTSKLSSYEDLASLDTFGFRGEALSSLCALSKFHVITARAEDGPVGKQLEFETSGRLRGATVVAAQRGTTVAIEGLFHNLPVRRKELDKNVKREYGKVLGHLYAYACISVGVRFVVSNQMPKGKKAVVFSTKSNTTTKENITNVFGAKTLPALVKLDLNLEMEPSKDQSTQSARNWSTQTRDRTRQVHVHGYISKPVFGEGRQVPDRQMFFVNSRPCGLPQVSKAFNEVYKSFNVSQSPFIFANLLIDTNAYDVNVSPDKRSIMLHDQTALLESLKASLTELFERTGHTVPQSQLPNQKLPNYKPLTVQRQPSREEPLTAADDASEGDSESDTEGRVRMNRFANGTPPSLIHDWIGRDTEERKKPRGPQKNGANLSESKQKHGEDVQKNSTAASEDGVAPDVPLVDAKGHGSKHEGPLDGVPAVDDLTQQADSAESPHDDPSSRHAELSRPVQDLNALMDRRHSNEATPSETEAASEVHSAHVAQMDVEPKIIAVAPSSQKATPGPVQNAFDRMRPKRTPLQTAEITIGETTTTTVLGSGPPYKRRRLHQPVSTQTIAQFGGSPLLARGLRNFAAPGSALESDSSQVSAHDEESAEPNDICSEDSESEETKDAEGDDANNESSDDAASIALDPLAPALGSGDARRSPSADDDEQDSDYVDEYEKKLQEEQRVAQLIQQAESAAAKPSESNVRRATQALRNTGNRKDSPLQLVQYLNTTVTEIEEQANKLKPSPILHATQGDRVSSKEDVFIKDELDDANAEKRLALTVSKTDFEGMHIIGQFNLGFILAVRPASGHQDEDELFIIDQHAADEKYNYERLQRTVTLQSQRLVRAKPLDLTAVEEEIVLNNTDALKANGFEIEMDADLAEDSVVDDRSAGHRCRLLTLPISGEKTFDLSDLEELLHLLSEAPAGSSEIPRPRKVQKMLAMRACRSSIMVGKTLAAQQMQRVVRHMGEMEKPWNCPHGRPTMRHLAGLGRWRVWKEGDVVGQDDEDGGIVGDVRLGVR